MTSLAIECIPLGALFTNCFVVYNDNKDCVIIDPGGEAGEVIDFCNNQDLKPHYILATHGHFDHIGGIAQLKREWDIPFALHSGDTWHHAKQKLQAEVFGFEDIEKAPLPDMDLAECIAIDAGAIHLEVVHTPGHSQGSVTFIGDEHILAGDLIFQGSIGRTDFIGGNHQDLIQSVHTAVFPIANGIIYPGHGPMTTVEDEIAHNPFFV